MNNKIIIVGGTPSINLLWTFRLKKDGFDVTLIERFEHVIDYLHNDNIDLLIVVLYSSMIKGLDLIGNVRNTISEDLIILSIVKAYDKVFINSILKKGADDCMVAPFRAGELSFRVDRLLFARAKKGGSS